jgi:hypothetical protein
MRTCVENVNRITVLVSFSFVFVKCPASLEQWLVNTPTASNDADRGAGAARDGLFRARRKTNTSLIIVGSVADNGGIIARGACECTTVANFLLDIANDGTFRTY